MSRPLVATYKQRGQELRLRYYARIDTAIPRAVLFLLLEGSPGDWVEIASNDHGFQIAVVKIKAGGKINISISRELDQD